MQVIALKMGFHAGVRRRVGAVFEMGVDPKKLPKWVKAVKDPAEAKAEIEAAKRADLERGKRAAIAASGGAAAKAKTDAIAESLAG